MADHTVKIRENTFRIEKFKAFDGLEIFSVAGNFTYPVAPEKRKEYSALMQEVISHAFLLNKSGETRLDNPVAVDASGLNWEDVRDLAERVMEYNSSFLSKESR